ncbi:hypothetical protein GCM10027570_45230 [Streptomonospora sediminis]
MPLLPAVVDAGASTVSAVPAVALSSVVVDINPLGITGGLILGAAPEETRPTLFRQLLFYGPASVAVRSAPALSGFQLVVKDAQFRQLTNTAPSSP